MFEFLKSTKKSTLEVQEQIEIIAMFDIAGFPVGGLLLSTSEQLEAIKKYLSDLFHIIEASGGKPNHVDGNALRAFWPVSESQSSKEKVGTAIVQALASIRSNEISGGRRFVPKVGLACGTTIHTTLCISGHTVPLSLGSSINFAMRLSMACSSMKKEILFPSTLPVTWPQSVTVEEAGQIGIAGEAKEILLLSLVNT